MSKEITIKFKIPSKLYCCDLNHKIVTTPCRFCEYSEGVFLCKIFDESLSCARRPNDDGTACYKKCDQCIKKYGTGEEKE